MGKLLPLPKKLWQDWDTDSLIYKSDNLLYYGKDVNSEVIKDIREHSLQIFSGYYEYKEGWKSPKIYLITYGKHSGKQKIKIEGFRPYCYIPDENGEYTDYLGNKVKKLVFDTHPQKVAEFRRKYSRKFGVSPYEGDILYCRRFLIDMYDFFKPKSEIYPPYAYVDVETNYPIGDDIISIAVNKKDSIEEEGELYFIKDTPLASVVYLLELINDRVMIGGWNFKFDREKINNHLSKIIDILEKATLYNLPIDKLIYKLSFDLHLSTPSDIKNLFNALIECGYIEQEDRGIRIIKDIPRKLENEFCCFDLLEMTRVIHAREIRGNWSLDNVGMIFCELPKIDIGGKHPYELDDDELFQYNVMDVIIPEEIDYIKGGVQYYIIMSWLLQSSLDDLLTEGKGSHQGRVNDITILREYHRHGIVLKSRSEFREVQNNQTSEKGKGRYDAADPKAEFGIYSGILVLDFVHAYPTITLALNASVETKSPEGEIEAINGVRFLRDKHSIFIDALKQFLKERAIYSRKKKTEKDEEKRRRYKFIDFGIKTQAAAFSHGLFGQLMSRMPDLEIAEAIAKTQRYYLELAEKLCEELGLKVVYEHTDSLFINCPKRIGKYVVEYLNKAIEEDAKKRNYLMSPRLEIKEYYPYGYIHSKARNVLEDEDGNWEVTGMSFYRSETPRFLAELEEKLIRYAFQGKSTSELQKILVNEMKRAENIDITELGLMFPLNKPVWKYGKHSNEKWHSSSHSLKECVKELDRGRWKGVPQHIKALLLSHKKFGLNIEVGEKFFILPVINNAGKTEILAFTERQPFPKEYKINFDKYFKNYLYGKVYRLLGFSSPKQMEKITSNTITLDMFG